MVAALRSGSLLSVIEGLELPLQTEAIIGEESEEAGAVRGLGVDVPFFAGPDLTGPPLTAVAPGTEGAVDGEGRRQSGGIETKRIGAPIGVGDLDARGWTETAKGNAGANRRDLRPRNEPAMTASGWAGVGQGEALDAEAFGAVIVGKDCLADSRNTNQSGNARQGDLKPHRFWGLR